MLFRIIPFHSMCQSYTGIGGEIAGGIVKLDSDAAVIMLEPGDNLPRSSCEVTIAANKGEGIALHIARVHLPRQIHNHCSSWLQIESESESNRGTWVRVKSFSEKICGSFDQETRNLSRHRGIWEPRHQFYNETASNHITIKFRRGNFNLKSLSFEIVVTPLTLNCGIRRNDLGTRKRDLFKCGDSADYCVDAGLVCDGKVNCMLPDKEAVDESDIFCDKKNAKTIVKAEPGIQFKSSIQIIKL